MRARFYKPNFLHATEFLTRSREKRHSERAAPAVPRCHTVAITQATTVASEHPPQWPATTVVSSTLFTVLPFASLLLVQLCALGPNYERRSQFRALGPDHGRSRRVCDEEEAARHVCDEEEDADRHVRSPPRSRRDCQPEL